MRKNVLSQSIIAATILLTTTVSAQVPDRFAYAVTDAEQKGVNWSYLRKMDLQTGVYSQVLLAGNDVSLRAYDAGTRKQMEAPLQDARYGNYVNAAFATGVAAVAYDKKNSRLYFTPMMYDQLRYIDLRTMKVYYVNDQPLTGKATKSSSQSDIVTRMAIASDGNGYALTNDGTQLIQFTTGKKIRITDLGSLVDDQANKDVSIHNSCSSYGGDMIADDNGNLYIFSARNHVFKVNIESKVATHLGAITGLPKGFTVNGAVVNDRNEIMVASAVQAASWFIVDAKSLVATEYKLAGDMWQSSDLGNSNVLVTKQANVAPVTGRVIPQPVGDGKVSLYPNPVTARQFAIQFNSLEAGQYTVQITDVMGRQVQQQKVTVTGEQQVQNMQLEEAAAKGVYMVKVLDASNKSVYTTKIVVQ